jgi:orotidine-5'-phosphate decarboxylase
MDFLTKFRNTSQKNNSLVCVGLDQAVFKFNKNIIDMTHDLVCAYKPNSAFYEGAGLEGIEALKKSCDYINVNYPEIPIILDAKRADIDSTNSGYIKFAFEYLQADALTLHPYLGKLALKSFLDLKDKFFFILCRTSNPGAGEFQDLVSDDQMLFEKVAQNVSKDWNANNNCGLVTGATYPEELQKIRKIVAAMPLLIPGIGAQGGDVQKTVLAASGGDFIISSSRGIIFNENPRAEAEKLKNLINQFRR